MERRARRRVAARSRLLGARRARRDAAGNRWGTALHDGFALYRAAEGSLRKRWAALLPITVQARLVWENWRGRLRYGEAAGYALRSALKPATLLAFLVIISWGSYAFYQDNVELAQAQAIVDRLDDEREDGKRATLELWSAQPTVRARTISRLLSSPGGVLVFVGMLLATSVWANLPDISRRSLLLRMERSRPKHEDGCRGYRERVRKWPFLDRLVGRKSIVRRPV